MKQAIVLSTVLMWLVPVFAQTDDSRLTGNVPITFYGRVVDQSNLPVQGVKINVQVREGHLTSASTGEQRWKPASLTTDANGDFSLNGASGNFLQFDSIVKEGYRLSPRQEKTNFTFYPALFHPDFANPIVFRMWKRRGAEHIVNSAWEGKVTADGTVDSFDLVSGKRAKEGTLQITCTRSPLTSPPPGTAHFDYSFRLAILGSEIQPTDDEFTDFAPERGYVASFVLAQKAEDPKWWGRVTKEFYIKTKDGRYGKLSVDWYASQNAPSHLEWNCSINPSGSRNLETE